MSEAASPERFVGIDVQSVRPCAWAALDRAGRVVDCGWLPREPGELARAVGALADRMSPAAFGVDAPRQPLPGPRPWYWRRGAWRPRRPSERGDGRHCEVVVKAHDVGNPQWTPPRERAPAWMQLGFAIFEALRDHTAHEVFPSASYRMLPATAGVELSLVFEDFRPGPRDMIDAMAAALTVLEFEEGRGQAVGDGDGLGAIVLPRPLDAPIEAVLRWPGAREAAA